MNVRSEINGQVYSIGKLDAMTQFHVARRLAPVFAALTSAIMGAKIPKMPEGLSPEDLKKAVEEAQFLAIAEPIMKVMATMPDADVNYVLNTCLGVVTRQVGNSQAPVMIDGALMFQDIDMQLMLRLVSDVLRSNLSSFFGQAPGALG